MLRQTDPNRGVENYRVSPVSKLISVVDDDQSMSRMLRRILTSAGFEVACFGSAEEFLDSTQLRDSDCLILDMNLPGMSGLELQQQLAQKGIDTPAVFISADADEAAQKRVLDGGAVSFLTKPFSIDTLLAKLRSVATLVLV